MKRNETHGSFWAGCLCAVLVGCSSASPTTAPEGGGFSGELDVFEEGTLFPDITPGATPNAGEETGKETGEETGDETGDETGEETGDETGEETGDEADVVVAPDASEFPDAWEPVDGEESGSIDAVMAEDVPQNAADSIADVTPETGIPVENFLTLCNTLEFLKKELTIEVSYKANVDANCPFFTGDNLAPVPAFSSARIDITKELELPLNSFPCEVRLKVLEKTYYGIEDGLIFRLNDIILLSNSEFLIQNTVEMPGSLSGLPLRRHEWETVKGLEYVTAGGPSYCLSETTPECVTPAPASQALFDYESDEAVSQDLAYDMATTGKSELTATLIGDDDPGDCQHSGFNVTVEVTYLDLSTE